MKNISTCIWFRNQAEEAVHYYASVFSDLKIGRMLRAADNEPVICIEFEIAGRPFMALNGNSNEAFNESFSLAAYCDTQEEIDRYWNTLVNDGGEESVCGWLKDKFGISWQITPAVLIEMINDPDRIKANRVMQVMMSMRKLEIVPLKQAYEGN